MVHLVQCIPVLKLPSGIAHVTFVLRMTLCTAMISNSLTNVKGLAAIRAFIEHQGHGILGGWS